MTLVTSRTLSRDLRRTQLIEATVATIAARGFSRTTLTEVAHRAGLSHGLVLFHFASKEKLLAATLDFLAEECRGNWEGALKAAGPEPESRLAALIAADFRPPVCQPDRLAAWCAFQGESQGRAFHPSRCAGDDLAHATVLEGLCAEMNRVHGYDRQPGRAARLIRLSIEGSWLELASAAGSLDRAEALMTALTCANALYPRHFLDQG